MKNSEIQQASFCLLSEIHSTVHRGTFKISFLVSIRLTNVAGKARMMATADRTHTTSLDISCQLCFTCSIHVEMQKQRNEFLCIYILGIEIHIPTFEFLQRNVLSKC
jgi:hypothetical protein